LLLSVTEYKLAANKTFSGRKISEQNSLQPDNCRDKAQSTDHDAERTHRHLSQQDKTSQGNKLNTSNDSVLHRNAMQANPNLFSGDKNTSTQVD
jgi:hypothetical protein